MIPLPFDPFDPPIIQAPKIIWRPLLLSPAEASFAKRRFAATSDAHRRHLELIGEAFIAGYNAGLMAEGVCEVRSSIELAAPFLRGFVAEGSAMGVALHDGLSLRKPLLPALLSEVEAHYCYLAHVGCGWAMARLPWRRRAILRVLDPLLQWLAYDGMGFHDTYFSHTRILGMWRRVTAGYAARAYDQGVGRALWFVSGASAAAASQAILLFPLQRQKDLWAGLGLAMAYAGFAVSSDFRLAVEGGGRFAGDFGQGVSFACEARIRAGIVPAFTETGAATVLGTSASEAAAQVRTARVGLRTESPDSPDYEIWRQRLRTKVSQPITEAAE